MVTRALLAGLPGPAQLRRTMQALAALDAIVESEAHYRLFSFDTSWREGLMLGAHYTGSGDHWVAAFRSSGVLLVGVAHETNTFVSGASPAWIFEGLPETLSTGLLDGDGFDAADANLCIWRLSDSDAWETGSPEGADDGSAWLLAPLVGGAESYVQLAREYFEVELELALVRRVFEHEALTEDLIGALSPSGPHEALMQELRRIGFPVAA